MRKLTISLLAFIAVLVAHGIFGNTVQAETIDQLQDKRSKVENERSKVKEKLSEAEAEIADILYDLKDLNEEITNTEAALKQNKRTMKKTEENIDQSEEAVAQLEEEITELEEDIKMRNNLLKERLSSLQNTGGTINYLEVLLGAETFTDFIGRATAISKIANSDKELMEQQEEDKELVVEKRDEVQEKLDELKEEKIELEGVQSLIEDQQKENKKKKKTLKKKEKKLKTLKADLEDEDSSLASLEEEIRQDIENQQASIHSVETVANTEENEEEIEEDNLTPLSISGGNGDLDTVIEAGFDHIGLPYVSAGKTPSTGFDCSGFVSWAFKQGGYNVPSSTDGLSSTGQQVSMNQAQPGDIVFFDTYKQNGHVGIYLGDGKFIGAQTSSGLGVADMNENYWKKRFEGHVRRIQ